MEMLCNLFLDIPFLHQKQKKILGPQKTLGPHQSRIESPPAAPPSVRQKQSNRFGISSRKDKEDITNVASGSGSATNQTTRNVGTVGVSRRPSGNDFEQQKNVSSLTFLFSNM